MQTALVTAMAATVIVWTARADASDSVATRDDDATDPSAGPNPRREAQGLELGVRMSGALPVGKSISGRPLSDAIALLLPVALDVGYRFGPRLAVGAYAEYGIGIAGRYAQGSLSDLSLGIDVRYHLRPDSTLDPWAGVGAGYEILSYNDNGGWGWSENGFQFAHVELGLDCATVGQLEAGPFVMLGVAEYQSCSLSGSLTGPCAIASPTLHGWAALGVRVAFDLPLTGSRHGSVDAGASALAELRP
jgi:hypothetical protein